MYRSYKAFSGGIYRAVMLVAYPVAAVLGLFLLKTLTDGEVSFVSMVLLCVCMPAVEIVSDYFFLSGINSKKAAPMEMLKGSANGEKIIKEVFCFDITRRAATIIFAYGVNFAIFVFCDIDNFTEMPPEDIGIVVSQMALYMLTTYFISEIGVFAARFSGVFWGTFAWGYFLPIASAASSLLYEAIAPIISYELQSIILAVISIVFTVFTVRFMKKRRRESYYDVRPEANV